jgi:polyisoprenoid-binding protein YceI
MKVIFLLMIVISFNAFSVDLYNIDNEHSFANFKIRHIVSKTSGTIPNINGLIKIDKNNLSKSSINVQINLMDINTNHKKRDNHIKEKKFLDINNFSIINFTSSKIESKNNIDGLIYGVLELHGVKKNISFPFKVLGFGIDPWGGYRVGIEAKTLINASDYGYKWGIKKNSSLGDKIEINLLIEGKKIDKKNSGY